MKTLIWTLLTILAQRPLSARDDASRPAIRWPDSAPLSASDPVARAGVAHLAERRRSTVILTSIAANDGGPDSPRERAGRALAAGADGWSAPVRICADGTLVIAVSDRLEDRWDGFGLLSEATWPELCLYRTREPFTGRLLSRRPVFAGEMIRAAVVSGACLALEPIGPRSSACLTLLLEAHGAFPNLVFTPSLDPDLPTDPRYRPLPWKALLTDSARALQQSAVEAALVAPGQILWTPAPRLAAEALGRPQPLPAGTEAWTPGRTPSGTESDRARVLTVLTRGGDEGLAPFPACKRAVAVLLTLWPDAAGIELGRILGDTEAALAARAAAAWGIDRLTACPDAPEDRPGPVPPDASSSSVLSLLLRATAADAPLGPEAIQALGRIGERRLTGPAHDILADGATSPIPRPTGEIVARQAAATALGTLGRADEETIRLLCQVLRSPSLAPDPSRSALDGAAAARALGELQARSAIEPLARAVLVIDPAIVAYWTSQERLPRARRPGDYLGRMQREAVAALARIGGDEAAEVLDRILDALETHRVDASEGITETLAWWTARAVLALSDPGRRAVELLARSLGPGRLAALEILEDPAGRPVREKAAEVGIARLESGAADGLDLLVRACMRAGGTGPRVQAFLRAARESSDPALREELQRAGPGASPGSPPGRRIPSPAGGS